MGKIQLNEHPETVFTHHTVISLFQCINIVYKYKMRTYDYFWPLDAKRQLQITKHHADKVTLFMVIQS